MTTQTFTSEITTPTRSADRRKSPFAAVFSYAWLDLVRHLKMVDSVFFTVALPVVLWLIFGFSATYGDQQIGNGNVAAWVASNMALYGAVVATSSIAGSAAVERAAGWGRLLALTPMRQWYYIAAKVIVGCAMAVLPIIAVLGLASATKGEMDGASTWVMTGLITLVVSIPFALYGLAIGLLFRSESAVSVSSGLLVVLAFFGNMFTPLSGSILEIARYTPLYGLHGLATWPQMEGVVFDEMGQTAQTDTVGMLLVNLGAWTFVFAVLAMIGARRSTQR